VSLSLLLVALQKLVEAGFLTVDNEKTIRGGSASGRDMSAGRERLLDDRTA
jgi:hypothetical protein